MPDGHYFFPASTLSLNLALTPKPMLSLAALILNQRAKN
jgi:hypothetical protein